MNKPSFPQYSELYIPLLAELVRRGGQSEPSSQNAAGKSIYEVLADYFELSELARNWKIYEADGTARFKWKNIVRWARNDLKKMGYLSSPAWGVWAITSEGRKHLANVERELIGQGSFDEIATVDLETFRNWQKETRRIGELGEQYVIEKEKDRLIGMNLSHLAKKVKQVSVENVAAGYDIISFEKNGERRFIEVKTSKSKNTSFELTTNELKTAQANGNAYWIYKVTEVESPSPNVIKLQNPANLIRQGKLLLKPTVFSVSLGEDLD